MSETTTGPADTARQALGDLADLAVGWTAELDASERQMAIGYAHQAGIEALDELERQLAKASDDRRFQQRAYTAEAELAKALMDGDDDV